MRDYLVNKGIRYELVGLHPKTKHMFWVYIKTKELYAAKLVNKFIIFNFKYIGKA